jgi:hypothetical protein
MLDEKFKEKRKLGKADITKSNKPKVNDSGKSRDKLIL